MLSNWLNSISPSLRILLAVLGVLAAVLWQWRSLAHFRRSRRLAGTDEQPRAVIRGFRDGMLCLGCLCAVVGLWLSSSAWLIFAGVFLFEELFETGIMLLAGRRSDREKV